ncbi:NfeD family protein [Pantoea sp. Mhis]|nr:NfeD family protein [Pantoea sp. Mhis]
MIAINGYLLWSGLSAILVGIITSYFYIYWPIQCLLFSVLTLLFMFFWYRWLRYYTISQKSNKLLNQRHKQLVGLHFILHSSLENGQGHIRIADSIWPIKANHNLPVGTPVIITNVEGIILIVQPKYRNN